MTWHTLKRLFWHRWNDQRHVQQFPPSTLDRITAATAASELQHSAQIRVCIEASLPTSYVWRKLHPRDRALTLFGKYRLWDTEQRNGVLIYILLVEQAIEIVADRGVSSRVSAEQLNAISAGMVAAFKAGHYEAGVITAIEQLNQLLLALFARAPGEAGPNEIDDRPVLL